MADEHAATDGVERGQRYRLERFNDHLVAWSKKPQPIQARPLRPMSWRRLPI